MIWHEEHNDEDRSAERCRRYGYRVSYSHVATVCVLLDCGLKSPPQTFVGLSSQVAPCARIRALSLTGGTNRQAAKNNKPNSVYTCRFARRRTCLYTCLYICLYTCLYICLYTCPHTGPYGEMWPAMMADASARLLLIAGGIGITPCISLALAAHQVI